MVAGETDGIFVKMSWWRVVVKRGGFVEEEERVS
jgi:hypothetical protein